LIAQVYYVAQKLDTTITLLFISSGKSIAHGLNMDKETTQVAKNSVWLIAQPLLLSLISLFVVGLVARKLGPNDYGVFVFAFAFVSLFSPFINMGLRALMVRTIAENRSIARECLGKMLVMRFILGVLAIIMLYIVLVIFDYPAATIKITLLVSSNLILQSVTSAFHDSFQAFEKMRYIAITQFFSGIILSCSTIIAVLLGAGLLPIVFIYIAGSLLALLMCFYYQWRYFELPILSLNISEFYSDLKQGFPFFVPQIIYRLNSRLGLILLSKFGGNNHVAIYGAATNLTDKLLVVPDGIGTSIFPAISSLFKEDKEAAVRLFQKFSRYIFLFGLPMAVGTTGLSEDIIHLIYGPEYTETTMILSLLIWGTFFQFVISIYDWTLNAMHHEKIIAKASFILIPFFIIPCYLLVKEHGVLGAALAHSLFQGVKLLVMSFLIKKYVTRKTYPDFFVFKAVISVSIMWVAIEYTKEINVILGFFLALISYGISIVALKLLNPEELETIKMAIRQQLQKNR
jgi:O-antigen/teichoic acid export membrane protein